MPSLGPERWLQLGPLLDEALEQPAHERAAWLSALRRHAPDDARDLEQLLSADGTTWLETGHRHRVLGRMAASPAEAGAVLGAWRLERTLGRGGMGTVWLASRADGRFAGQAAVKLLHPSLIEGLGEDYFRREAEVLARLTHPAIARLYDAGVTTDGQPYLVLEYVDGVPLDRWLSAQHPSLARRLDLLERIGDAVAHAHAHGIVHRDIKPANLVITTDDEVKLLDFGIALLVDEANSNEVTASVEPARSTPSPDHAPSVDARSGTSSDTVHPFTPRYAAPEQMQGGPITTATDVYALGRILSELLHSREPVPLDLHAIVARATTRVPAQRYPTVSALTDDIRRFRHHEPVTARNGNRWYRVRRFARRHRAGFAAGCVALLALLVATAMSVVQARNARAQRDAARAAERRAQLVGEVMLSLATELPTSDTAARAIDALRRTRVLLDGYLGTDRAERARLAIDLSRQFGFFARFTEAQDLLDDARTDARAVGDEALLTEIECALGAGGDSLEPAAVHRVIDSLTARLPRTAWRAHAACASAAGRRYLMQFAGDSANAQSALALQWVRAAGDTVSLLYANLLVDQLQTIGWSAGDFHAKRMMYRDAIRVLEKLGLGSSIPALRVATLLSGFARETGRLLVADSALAPSHAYLTVGDRWRVAPPTLLLEQAQVAGILGQDAEARAWFERAIEVTRAPGSELLATRARQLYAQYLAETGDVREARVHLEALTQLLAAQTNSAFDAARIRTIAALHAAEGQPVRAAALVDSLLRSRGYPDKLRLVSWQDVVTEHAHYQWQRGAYAAVREAIDRVRAAYAGDSVTANGSYRLARLAVLDARLRARDGDTAASSAAREAVRQLTVAIGAEHPLTREARRLATDPRP